MAKFEEFYAVVGADRVGKSTKIAEMKQHLLTNYRPEQITVAHFSGPSPKDNSPIDQYMKVLEQVTTPVVICDRFGSEVCFYENFRRHLTISEEWAHAVESYAVSESNRFALLYITAEWETVRPRHIEEITKENSESTLYYKKLLLGAREKEHAEYQKYMDVYLTERTGLDPQFVYFATSENPCPAQEIRHGFYARKFLS